MSGEKAEDMFYKNSNLALRIPFNMQAILNVYVLLCKFKSYDKGPFASSK